MKIIDVRDQVSLSLAKCAELVLSGIKYRLFRSAVTVTIISLAIAFLMTMLTESFVARRVTDEIDARIAPQRLLRFWVGQISTAMTETELTARLAGMTPGNQRWKEFQAWGNVTDNQLDKLRDIAGRQLTYEDFFQVKLAEGERRPMVGRAQGTEIFALLQDPERLVTFEEEFGKLGRQMPTSLDEFKSFLADWKMAQPQRAAICAGHKAAQEKLQPIIAGREPKAVLAQVDEKFLEALRKNGFQLATDEVSTVSRQAAFGSDIEKLGRLLRMGMVQRRLAQRLNIDKEVNAQMFFSEISSRSGAKWLVDLTDSEQFLTVAGEQGIRPLDMSAERVRQVAKNRLSQSGLSEVQASLEQTTGKTSGFLGFSSRTWSLIFVSMVVCGVGIANAMIMSVTDRYREIATMKCLGATDGYIMINFIFESVLQGTAGGIIGVILGFLLGLMRSSVAYGWLALQYVPVLLVLTTAGASLLVGVVLSAGMAVWPARIAAKLPPMEAMRIE